VEEDNNPKDQLMLVLYHSIHANLLAIEANMANILDMNHLCVVEDMEDNEDVIQNLLCSYLIYNNKKEAHFLHLL
jgi:hypothetical protein